MANSNYSEIFSCPKCGIMGAIYVVKVSGNQIVIKQRCPTHGGRVFKVPLLQKDEYIDLIRDGVFRCYKCGQESVVSYMKPSGPWIQIKCSCPTHGEMIIQKIWNSIYNEISSEETVESQPEQAQLVQSEAAPKGEGEFCPHCNAPIIKRGRFCGNCGAELD
jgi:hypothetical protein